MCVYGLAYLFSVFNKILYWIEKSSTNSNFIDKPHILFSNWHLLIKDSTVYNCYSFNLFSKIQMVKKCVLLKLSFSNVTPLNVLRVDYIENNFFCCLIHFDLNTLFKLKTLKISRCFNKNPSSFCFDLIDFVCCF